MGWIVVILILYVVIYNIREADKKEKREAEDEARCRRNEEIERQAIIDWNDGVCPNCNEEWVLDFHKERLESHYLCHCPKCDKKLFDVPEFVNYSKKWHAYFANASEKKQLDRQKELSKTRAAASERRNKMF